MWAGPDKHEVNTRILAAAASVSEGLHGPSLLRAIGMLLRTPLNPFVCCRSTLAFRMLRNYVRNVRARFRKLPVKELLDIPFCLPVQTLSFDLDTHAVLFAETCFPRNNPVVQEWVAPCLFGSFGY